jgi:5-formyltetrahydrofolate cyclo-ligase
MSSQTPEGRHKQKLREQCRVRRTQIQSALGALWGPQERDLFFDFLGQLLPGFSGSVCSYFAMGSEPSIMPRDPTEQWFFPVVVGSEIHWFPWDPSQDLPQPGPRGCREMAAQCTIPPVGGVCFVPSLAIDQEGFRLGYGGGYYDRFLQRSDVRSSFLAVACTHDDLLFEALPREPHDQPVDVVVTFRTVRPLIGRDQMLSKLGKAN